MTHSGALLGSKVAASIIKDFAHHQGRNVQTTTICGGQLYIHVFSTTVPNIHYGFKGRMGEVLCRILPSSGDDIQWPLRAIMTDDDAGQIALALAAAVPHPWDSSLARHL